MYMFGDLSKLLKRYFNQKVSSNIFGHHEIFLEYSAPPFYLFGCTYESGAFLFDRSVLLWVVKHKKLPTWHQKPQRYQKMRYPPALHILNFSWTFSCCSCQIIQIKNRLTFRQLCMSLQVSVSLWPIGKESKWFIIFFFCRKRRRKKKILFVPHTNDVICCAQCAHKSAFYIWKTGLPKSTYLRLHTTFMPNGSLSC
jgi:hypothetical protein